MVRQTQKIKHQLISSLDLRSGQHRRRPAAGCTAATWIGSSWSSASTRKTPKIWSRGSWRRTQIPTTRTWWAIPTSGLTKKKPPVEIHDAKRWEKWLESEVSTFSGGLNNRRLFGWKKEFQKLQCLLVHIWYHIWTLVKLKTQNNPKV